MTRTTGLLTALVLTLAAPAADAGSFTVSNPIYDLKVTYGFEADRAWHEVELTNKLEIQLTFGTVEAELACATGTRAAGEFGVPRGDVPAGATRTFSAESVGCSPREERDPTTRKLVDVHDEIRAVDYSGIVHIRQHGTSFNGPLWECGEERIVVAAIKFPEGTGFKLLASNGRSMTSTSEFDEKHADEAVAHLCGEPVDDPLDVAAGVRKLIGEVRTFCTRAPRFCDKAYDVNNKRAATAVRG